MSNRCMIGEPTSKTLSGCVHEDDDSRTMGISEQSLEVLAVS